MFISNVKMIEPATASFAVYLLTRTTKIKPHILKREPFHYKKRICKWIMKNKHVIIDIGMDEMAEYIFDFSNYIQIHTPPTLPIILYSIALIILIFI
jgi:hypothetical protein